MVTIKYLAFVKSLAENATLPDGVENHGSGLLARQVESLSIPRIGEKVGIQLTGDAIQDNNWRVKDVTYSMLCDHVTVLLTNASQFSANTTQVAFGGSDSPEGFFGSSTIPRLGELVRTSDSGAAACWQVEAVTHDFNGLTDPTVRIDLKKVEEHGKRKGGWAEPITGLMGLGAFSAVFGWRATGAIFLLGWAFSLYVVRMLKSK